MGFKAQWGKQPGLGLRHWQASGNTKIAAHVAAGNHIATAYITTSHQTGQSRPTYVALIRSTATRVRKQGAASVAGGTGSLRGSLLRPVALCQLSGCCLLHSTAGLGCSPDGHTNWLMAMQAYPEAWGLQGNTIGRMTSFKRITIF